jgi:hypothetical protein
MAKPNSSYQQVGADWGLQTLRQACFQENPESAMCVQNFDDSRGLAIRITYRISLRSSSLWEPRHPLLKVVMITNWGSHYKSSHYPYPSVKSFFLVIIGVPRGRWGYVDGPSICGKGPWLPE